MRKVITALTVLAVLIVVALLVVPRFVDVNNYRGRIQAELQQRLNRPVALGHMRLGLLPPAFTVDNAVIGEDPRFGQQPFATMQQLSIRAELWPLLHKQFEISALELKRPHMELIRDAQGRWNVSTMGQAQQQQAPQPQPQQPQPQQQAQGAALQLHHLKITDGQLALTDYQKHQSRAVYDHIDLDLKNFAPDKRFDIVLAAHLPGKGAQTLSLDGAAGPINQANMTATPFDGKLKLNQVSIDGVQKFLNTQALQTMGGIISGSARVQNQNSVLTSDGSLKVEEAVLRGVPAGYPVSFDYKLKNDLNTDTIQIEQGDIRLGSTPIEVSGTFQTRAPAQTDLKLKAKDVSLAEAARLASAFGIAFDSNTKVDGRVTADISAKGAVNKPALNGTIAARNLKISGEEIPAPVSVPAIDLLLTPQQVRSGPFTATAENTSVNAEFTLTNYTSPAPAIDATVRTSNAQIANLLTMARAYGVQAVKGMNGSGQLTFDVRATGPIKDANALSFNGTGKIQNASLQTLNLRQPVRVSNADLRFTSNGAQMQNVAASLGQTDLNGVVTVRNFKTPNVQFTLTANKANVTELQQIMRPAQQSGAQTQRSSLSIVPQASAAPAATQPSLLNLMTGGGTLSVGTIQYDQLTLTNARANVTIDRGVIGLSPVTAQLYDGLENGAITVDTRSDPMTVQVRSTLQRVQANPLLSAVSSLKNTIYGLLAANGQLSFQAANSNDIARTLNGTMTVNLSNGRIAKVDLLNQLAAIGKFAGVRKNPQAVTDFTKLTGHFNVVNGVASTEDLRAEIAGGTFAADGTVDLASQQLNMRLTAVMSKGFTEQVGGTGIGGFMQTALANNRGELVMPVLVSGTFDNPQIAPDVQKLAQMKLENMLPTTGNPGAMTAGALGGILKGGNVGGAAGGLGGIVGAITGQQQQAPQQQQGQPVASPQNAPQQQQAPGPADAINEALQGVIGGEKKEQPKPQQAPKR